MAQRVAFQCHICNDPTYIRWEPQPAGTPVKFVAGCVHAGEEAHRLTGDERWLAFAQPNHDTSKGK